VSWAWWDWPLTWLTNHRPSVLWHCWLGHVTCKIVSEMTYNVSSGTLNSTIPYHLGVSMMNNDVSGPKFPKTPILVAWIGISSQICEKNRLQCCDYINKCIGDDTKAATRQSPNCIFLNIYNMAKNDFQYGGCNYYTMQCGMWLRNHDSEFAKWQHPAMWYVALRWHAMEFAQTIAILKFYIWFRFWPYHRSRHVILHQSAKFYPNRTTLRRKKWRHVDFQDGGSQPSWIVGIQ